MQKIVIDTNVVISAALSSKGNPSKIINSALDKEVCLFYSSEIMDEYIEVLSRSHFNISSEKKQYLIEGADD